MEATVQRRWRAGATEAPRGPAVKPGPSVGVLGAGSWGTALAVLLARNGLRVAIWGRDRGQVEAIARERENRRYLPGVVLPDTLAPEWRLHELVRQNRQFLLVVPSRAFRAMIAALQDSLDRAGLPAPETVVWGTKGLDPESDCLLSEIVRAAFGSAVTAAVISGPSFANELGAGLPTALAAAADDARAAERIAAWFRNERTRVYTNTDLAGVQLGGAIKNVMAIAAGISDGLGLGANARAALVTRGLAEMRRLGELLGGRPGTFLGLTGLGDLILSCTDDQSRNRRLGLGLGRGRTAQEMFEEIGQAIEGATTAEVLNRLARRRRIDAPITEQVYRILFEDLAPQQAVETLLSREPRAE